MGVVDDPVGLHAGGHDARGDVDRLELEEFLVSSLGFHVPKRVGGFRAVFADVGSVGDLRTGGSGREDAIGLPSGEVEQDEGVVTALGGDHCESIARDAVEHIGVLQSTGGPVLAGRWIEFDK